VIEIKYVYNSVVTFYRYDSHDDRGRGFEEGEYARRVDAVPGDGLDPVVKIVEDLGTIEIPCGKVDCRSNCLEYLVRPARERKQVYSLADCKLSPLVRII
jgi:hypothetical protein